jgi:hypothetical protein
MQQLFDKMCPGRKVFEGRSAAQTANPLPPFHCSWWYHPLTVKLIVLVSPGPWYTL